MAFSRLLFLRLSLFWVGTCSVTIHYTTPGKTPQDPAGVFKVALDIDTLVNDHTAYTQESIVEHQFVCAKVGSMNYSRLNIRSLSYDSPALRTYIQLEEGGYDSSTAVYGNTCEPDPDCSSLNNVKQVMNMVRTTDKGFINSLTSWDGTLYFVYTPDGKDAVYFGYRPYLEIRQVRDGYSFPTQVTTDSLNLELGVNIDVFSTLLIRIAPKEKRRWLQAGTTLRVLPGEGSGLVFITVVRAALYQDPPRNNTLEEFHYALVAARVGGESEDEAAVLHLSEDTWADWYGIKLDLEGGVSYNEGTVCWTAADTILCGTWSPEQPLTPPIDVITVLQAGEALKIFHGPQGLEAYANVTTGVVIAESPETSSRLVLFFGCLAAYQGMGGLGMLVRQYPQGETVLIGVSDKDGPLLGGAMVIVPDQLQCQTPPSFTYAPGTPTSSSSILIFGPQSWLLFTLAWMLLTTESSQQFFIRP